MTANNAARLLLHVRQISQTPLQRLQSVALKAFLLVRLAAIDKAFDRVSYLMRRFSQM